jgi:DMSO/TMAO reductase YedYZ molybdopterin-dependent catalytic subunit
MVDREVRLDWQQLISSSLVERDVTLMCVSNEVGGNLVGNARWLGLPIAGLLRRAGAHRDADMVLSTSADGWTCSTPLEVLTDGRDAMLAVGMNGAPLPIEHGFPVRMVVPGLYGYVSATKWVVDLEVTRFDLKQGYWTPRGWSARAPVKTQSRIDVPSSGASVRAGQVAVAGVAWAQHRGIRGVEVRVDGGSWQPAQLAAEASVDTWRQWVWRWDATPGQHVLEVRATDGTGAVQTGQPRPPAPDGATGWHRIKVTVT